MKMKRLDRAALYVFALIVLIVLVVAFACGIEPTIAEDLGFAFSVTMKNYPLLRAPVILFSLALAALLCAWLWSFTHGKERETPIEPVSLNEDDGGSVMISQAALEALVRRSAGPVEGVNRFDVKLEKRENALDVTLVMSVRQGVRIPELAQAARQNVRETLEGMTGVKVENVTLLVSDITTDAPASSDGRN